MTDTTNTTRERGDKETNASIESKRDELLYSLSKARNMVAIVETLTENALASKLEGFGITGYENLVLTKEQTNALQFAVTTLGDLIREADDAAMGMI